MTIAFIGLLALKKVLHFAKSRKKWGTYEICGKYLDIEFNGKVFTPDEGGPYAMDLGPDFYAAQNFNIASLEDDRVIEMAWLDSWNGGLNTTHWSDQVLKANQNFLSGINSKAFNFEVEIDLEKTTATQVIFQITDQKIVYDITEKLLAGKLFIPLDNKVQIRMLVDWGHVKSKDFITWEYLPCALAPDKTYDQHGCFSGSAIEWDGKHLIAYTGVEDIIDEEGNRITRQTQCVAVGDDLDYEKLEINPVVTTKMIPEGSSLEDFRDPKLFIKGEELYFVIGSRADDGSGQVLLYKSKDAINK